MRAMDLVRSSRSRLHTLRSFGNDFMPILTRRTFFSSRRSFASIGFVGLGRMGYPMALNLRAKVSDFDKFVIYDRNTDATAAFAGECRVAASSRGMAGNGIEIEIVNSPREVAENSETIITVLPEPAHVKSVFHDILSSSLSLSLSAPERIFIDCSTIDPSSSREVANAVHRKSQGHFFDAPMSGGVVGARAATLTFMLGASLSSGHLLERATTILKFMGSKVLYMGDQGMGLSAKLANNYLLALNNISTAEAMNLGLRMGLNPMKLGQLINSSSGRCWSSETNNPVAGISPGAPAANDFEGGFDVGLMRKDLRLAMEEAGRVGAKLEMADKAAEVYDKVAARYPSKDHAVVYRWLGEAV